MKRNKLAAGLLSVPVLKQALDDPYVQIGYRPIDSNWTYEKIASPSAAGFNPYHSKIYVPSRSALADWIRVGCLNDRRYNESDILVKEAMFFAHDYLHAWAVRIIQQEMPSLGFGHAPITKKNFEDFVFCHILTEAVATVGVDYWYLSTVNLSEVTGTGTNLETLTISYHERDLAEFQKFNKLFTVQNESFLVQLNEFYCTGEFIGFSLADLRRSPKLKAWLQHELLYGSTQRKYTREWLSYLSNGTVKIPSNELAKVVSIVPRWRKDLSSKMAKHLWAKVKHGSEPKRQNYECESKSWKRDSGLPIDPRFTNISALSLKEIENFASSLAAKDHFNYFFAQYVSAYEFNSFSPADYNLLSYVKEKKDFLSLFRLFERSNAHKVSKRGTTDSRDLFFPA